MKENMIDLNDLNTGHHSNNGVSPVIMCVCVVLSIIVKIIHIASLEDIDHLSSILVIWLVQAPLGITGLVAFYWVVKAKKRKKINDTFK